MECSRPWLLALCVLVLLNTISLLGSRRPTQEDSAHQQSTAWKTYALPVQRQGQGLWTVELNVQTTASTAQSLPRFSF
jgi:hypothetical protein